MSSLYRKLKAHWRGKHASVLLPTHLFHGDNRYPSFIRMIYSQMSPTVESEIHSDDQHKFQVIVCHVQNIMVNVYLKKKNFLISQKQIFSIVIRFGTYGCTSLTEWMDFATIAGGNKALLT